MTTAAIVRAWHDGQTAFLAIAVPSDRLDHEGNPIAVEYIAGLPLADLAGLSEAEQLELLRQAAIAERSRSLALAAGPDEHELPHTGPIDL